MVRIDRRTGLSLIGGALSAYVLTAHGVGLAYGASLPEQDPDTALDVLKKGNARYVAGNSVAPNFVADRDTHLGGQSPIAAIISCADSRVSPEFAFDQGRGQLFVMRVAGNILTADGLASLEYGVLALGVRPVIVLGHGQCGAVDAAIKVVRDGADFPGHLPGLIRQIAPAVRDVAGSDGSMLDNAIRANVKRQVEAVTVATPILSRAIADGRVKAMGGVYNLETGQIDFVG